MFKRPIGHTFLWRCVLLRRIAVIVVAIIAVTAGYYGYFRLRNPRYLRPDPNPAAYSGRAPLQYQSYLDGRQQNEKTSKFDKFPALTEIYAGMPFSEDYYTTRNHQYAVEDLRAIRRGKPTAFCITCKTADFNWLLREMGEANLNAAAFNAVDPRTSHPIACIDCHDTRNFSLAITRPTLVRGLSKIGIDITKASGKDMRTFVCAQCHVEYFFNRSTNELILPWDNGIKPEEVERFFQERNWADWTHPGAQVPLVKIQHPEYENYQGSIHDRLGVTCADCHMPQIEVQGRAITSHSWTSPLLTIDESCGTCHRGDNQALVQRVQSIQNEVLTGLKETAELMGQAVEAIQAADLRGAPTEQLASARAAYARAHIRWDWVQSENGNGFHNAALARRLLNEIRQFVGEAISQASEGA